MTRYGVALDECVLPEHDATLRALDAFAERSTMPAILPIWCREWQVSADLVRSVRSLGPEVVMYVETLAPIIPVDTLLRFADAVGDGTAVRINQEMDGSWGAHWQDWETRVFTEHFSACSFVLGGLRVWWCPSSPLRAFGAGYWPGEADIVGFDAYAAAKPPAVRWARAVADCTELAPAAPVWVGETGIKAGEPKRAGYIRSLGDVEGVDVIVVMNLVAEQPRGGFDDWRFTPAMDRAFAELVTT